MIAETLLVFDGGARRLACEALQVRSITAGELWTGEPPLQVGALLNSGPGMFERRTRVLELETSDGHDSVPVLARGEVALSTVTGPDFQPPPLALLAELDSDIRAFIDSVVDDGHGPVLVLAPDALRRFIDAHPEPPLPSSRPPTRLVFDQQQ